MSDADILAFDPFAGDYGDDEVQLSNKMVIGRKEYVCHICAGPVAVGERHRALTEAWDGKVATTRFCAVCCEAMAISWTDDGATIEERYGLGMRRRKALPDPLTHDLGSAPGA